MTFDEKIDASLQDEENRRQYEAEMDRLDILFKPWTDAIEESENITEEDLRIVINAKPL